MIVKLQKCNLLIFIAYLLFILILVSLYQYLNLQDNKCLMTFMYATPNFIQIPLPKKVEINFNKYKIYAYKEGKKDDKFNYSDFNGFPVLFIPGSSGSHKQVRSFASISMNFNRHYVTKTHLDFFSIDFNEELSGIYGPYLKNQTNFLNHAIKIIKRLYYNKQKTKDIKLIVIAHSFGGIIFKGLLNLPSFKLDDIFLFLTLATPHQKSVFPFDSSFHIYYSQIQNYTDNFSKYQQIAKISIGGGLNDNLVRSDLTNLNNELNQWSLTSNSLPEVWVTADHKCIVWCKQLIKKLVHLIFDLLEERLEDQRLMNRNLIIEHHLNYRSNDHLTPRYNQLESKLNLINSKKYEINKRLFIINKLKIIDTLIYKFKFQFNTFYSIISTNLHKSDWLFACKLDLKECIKITKLINRPIPSDGELYGLTKRNHFIINSNDYLSNNYSELILQLNPSTIQIRAQIERIINGRRDLEIEMPTILNRLIWFFNPFKTIVYKSIADESTYFNLTLNNFNQIWHNFNLRFEINRCYDEHKKEDLIINLNIPWYKDNYFNLIELKKYTQWNTILSLNVPNYDHKNNDKINLQLLLDPFCEYRLKIKFSLRETIIQLFRHYSFLFLPIISSILLSSYSNQLNLKINQNELLNKKIEYYQNLKFILINQFNDITFYGLLPTIPFLINKLILLIDYKFNNYFKLNLISTNYTNHNSNFNQLFSNYLIYFFIYFIVFIMIHLFSSLFSLIINNLIYLKRTQFYSQFKNHLFNSSKSQLNKYTNSRSLLFIIFLLLIYLKLIFYFLILVYLIKLVNLTIQSNLNQNKIGLNRINSRFNLEISKFIILILSFLPLIPKLIVWFMTNDNVFYDKITILFKISFIITLAKLLFLNNDDVIYDKKNTLIFYLIIKFAAIICLCFAHLDYTVITICLNLIIILHSVNEFIVIKRNDQLKKLC